MSAARGAPRHQSRQVALQVLYAVDLGARPAPAPAPDASEVFEGVAANFDLHEGARAFAKELVFGVMDNRDRIDALLSDHTRNWRLSRMAAVDRNILRLGTFELIQGETPVSVVLDEAIELARRFGADPSPAFVNGVLDAVARAVGVGELEHGGGAG